jgi:hypothetical protein
MTDTDELRNEIRVEAAGSTDFELGSFARVFARRLEEAEQVYDLNVEFLRCNGPHGRRLELLGYAEDPTEDSLILLAGRYFGDDVRLTPGDAREAIGRATGFIDNAVSGWLGDNLEVSSRESEYADYFASRILGRHVSKMRVLLITDGVMSDRIRAIDSDVVAGLRTSYEIWDANRILDAAMPERGSEDINVDFTTWLPDGLPCLVADTSDPTTTTYLAVIPGRVLAEVFDEYGSLLLESNVRTFLSARGAVNRGIQATLAQQPDRFLAYNNGLTTTSTEVELIQGERGDAIRSIQRWQIVNGGQTTASIAHFLRGGRDRPRSFRPSPSTRTARTASAARICSRRTSSTSEWSRSAGGCERLPRKGSSIGPGGTTRGLEGSGRTIVPPEVRRRSRRNSSSSSPRRNE